MEHEDWHVISSCQGKGTHEAQPQWGYINELMVAGKGEGIVFSRVVFPKNPMTLWVIPHVFLWLTPIEPLHSPGCIWMENSLGFFVWGGFYLGWTDICSPPRKSSHNSREAGRLPRAGERGYWRALWRMLAVEEVMGIYHCQCPACDVAPWLCKMFPPRETGSRACRISLYH